VTASPAAGNESVARGALDVVPVLRDDYVRRDVGGQTVVWSPISPYPVAFDSVATVMLDVVDSVASVADLATDVHEALEVDRETALQQVIRVVNAFEGAGLLTSSVERTTAEAAITDAQIFVASSTACSENASRLATETLYLRFGDQVVRVACDSRRGARRLRDALAEHVVDDPGGTDEPPLAFVLTAPQGLKRSHSLTERAGFVLSSGRGLDPGLHALASHLTALLPPITGSVQIRGRALVVDGRTVFCMPPLLYMPTLDDRSLSREGLATIDRLAFDIEIRSGRMVNRTIPWPSLAELGSAAPHLGVGEPQAIDMVVDTAAPGAPPPAPAAVVARLAANGVHGSPADLLEAASRIVERAEVRPSLPQTEALLTTLRLPSPRG
jgi:hypothetical protein